MADDTKNVKLSFEERVTTQLKPTYTIHWQGLDFDSATVTAWIEPRLLGRSAQPSRLSERVEAWTFQCNVYAKTGPGGETTHRVWELADAVIDAFDQATFAVKDWADAALPTLFYLRCSEGDVVPVPSGGGRPSSTAQLQQLAVSFIATLIG